MSDLREFVDLLLTGNREGQEATNLTVDYLTIVSVEGDGTCSLELPGATDPLRGVRYFKGADLAPGDKAMVLQNGPDWVVVGAFA